MLSKTVKFLLLTEAFAVATFALGWWGVAALAFAWGLAVEPSTRSIRFATICAAAGWASLLLLDAARGPVGEVAARFGGVMRLSPLVLIAFTLLFPALLAWSASTVAAAIRQLVPTRSAESAQSPPTEPTARTAGQVAIADV